jgi:hypothetical protein
VSGRAVDAARVSWRAVTGRELVEVSAPIAVPAAHLQAFLVGGRMHALAGTRAAGPGTAAAQGGWWYRGEWSARRTADTTLLVHRVVNVAHRGAWAVPLANRFFVGFREQCQRGVADLARRIEDELRRAGP